MVAISPLAAGQVWVPAVARANIRSILDVSEGRVRYVEDAARVGGASGTISEAGFRDWIGCHGATLRTVSVTDSPAANMSPGEVLAQRIKSLRKMAGLTQEGLAAALSTSRTAVAFWETAREGDIRKYIPKMAALFGVPEETFLNGLDTGAVQEYLTSDEADLIRHYRRLTPTQKIVALKKVRGATRIAEGELD